MIIERHDDTENDIVRVVWKFKDSDQEYQTSWCVCDNPFCKCAEMTFEIGIGVKTKPMASFVVDVGTSKIIKIGSDTSSKLLSEQLVAELTGADHKLLYEIFVGEKEKIIDEFDIYEFEPPVFPENEIENESQLVGFKEILPWSKVHWFTVENKEYHLIDLYCLNPACDCKDTSIDFLCYSDKKQINKDKPTLVAYSLDTGRWKTTYESDLVHPVSVLMQNMLSKYPDIRETFNRRKTVLLSLYKRHKKTRGTKNVQEETRPSSALAGRNQPCPCGSGKKYKKCCGKS